MPIAESAPPKWWSHNPQERTTRTLLVAPARPAVEIRFESSNTTEFP